MKAAIRLGLVLLLSAACGRPQASIEVGVKEYPTDVLLGAIDASDLVDQGVQIPIPFGSATLSRPTQKDPRVTQSTSEAEACPTASAFDVPALVATNRTTTPPRPQTLNFRTSGTVNRQSIAENAEREISPHTTRDAGFSFDIVEDLATRQTRQSFFVAIESSVPPGAVPPDDPRVLAPESGRAPGVYIEKTIVSEPGRQPVSFSWSPALKVLEFPARPGAKWSVRSVTASGSLVFSYEARITPQNHRVLVDACGRNLDAWSVDLTGTYSGPSTNLKVTSMYAFGTQFGGVSLRDIVKLEGTASGQPIKEELFQTINSVPTTQ